MQISDITDILGLTYTKEKEPDPADNPVFNIETASEKKILYVWEAPLRTNMKGFGGKLKKNLLIVAGVLGFLLLLIGEFPIIIAVAGVVFISYVLANTPVENVIYKITSHGINYVGQFYYWNELGNFFIENENGVPVLNIDIRNKIPARLFLTLKEGDENKIKEICNKYLPYLKNKPETLVDKACKKLVGKLDL